VFEECIIDSYNANGVVNNIGLLLLIIAGLSNGLAVKPKHFLIQDLFAFSIFPFFIFSHLNPV
jgi:hypothetical protein